MDSPAFLIADGASEEDEKNDQILSGKQQRLLTKLITSVGLEWNQFWKTALIKEPIKQKKVEENKELVNEEYKKILIEEINTLKPNILIPLSELSFNFLTGLNGIRKFRGSLLPPSGSLELFRPDLRVLPILGPSPYLYEDTKLEFITRLDLEKIKTNLYKIGPIPQIGKCWVAETGSQVAAFLDRHFHKTLKENGFLVFDIETFCNLPTCISFCFDGQESCCIPIMDYKIEVTQLATMLDQVLKVLRSPIRKVNQNIKFDWRKLTRFGFQVSNISGDTALAHSCLYAEFPKNLSFLTSIYTDIPYFKDEGKEFDPASYDRNKLYIYNAKDSLATHQIYTQQQIELVTQGVDGVYKNLIKILPIYKEMEDNGILVDDTERKRLLSKYIFLFEMYCEKLKILLGRPLNPLSAPAVGKLVYEEMEWKVVRGVKHSKKTQKPSADGESLEILLWSSECKVKNGSLILRTIMDCRKLHKCIEFLSLPTYPDGRHRCEFNLAGTETGRTTASETTDYYMVYDKKKIKLINLGHSFQTIGKHGFIVDGTEYGKDLRSIFVPSPGWSFVECDLSQAEARVDAVLSCDFDILPIFDSPLGIHRLTGSWVFNCPPEEIRKNELTAEGDRYHIAKTVRHAAERNMTPSRLLMMIYKEISYCAKVLATIHKKQPNLRGVFHRDVREQVQNERCLVAPNGRRRDFCGRIDEHTINEAISFLPQAIVTDYLKRSLAPTISECRDFVRPLSESHDGFLAEVRSGYEERYGKCYKRNIEKPINFKNCSLSRDFELTIPCSVEMSSTNWQELKEIKF